LRGNVDSATGSGIALRRRVTRRSRFDTGSALATAERCTITPADEFFFALEGRDVDANGERWSVEVYGIHSDASQHWLQLQLRGTVTQGLTLRVPRLDLSSVLQMVQQWLEGSLPAALETAVTGRAHLPALTN
jgi:hypothetical protein